MVPHAGERLGMSICVSSAGDPADHHRGDVAWTRRIPEPGGISASSEADGLLALGLVVESRADLPHQARRTGDSIVRPLRGSCRFSFSPRS